MRAGAILLVGGRSTRMGRAKAGLDWHGEPLAARVARVLARAVGEGPVVAVAAPGQALPPLPAGVTLAADPTEGAGPLQGLAVGLAALGGNADVAFASSVDAPLLHPRLVRAVLGALRAGDDAAVPVAHGHRQPLAAAYRTGLAALADQLIAEGERGLGGLLGRARTRFLNETELLALEGLATFDPGLDALHNVNTPEEYEAALRHAAPDVVVEVRGSLRDRATASRLVVPARRLAEAVAATGLELDERVAVELDGQPAALDPLLPLGAGDHVTLAAASGGA
jgi:molybdopterin-guanine dinucleotide biosynthesis protein A